jgi:CRISPR/Cas system endoribonuclease Cas6 (RAMP superfamily)
MKATLLYRIASVSFVLFAAGHTFGFLNFKPPTPEGLAVRDAMNNVHFGPNLSYGAFYVGFGLYVTVYLLFSAFLAWHLARLAGRLPQAIGALGWAFFAVQLASLALSCVYFAAPPAVLSALVAACLGWAMWQVRGAEAGSAIRRAAQSQSAFAVQRGGA